MDLWNHANDYVFVVSTDIDLEKFLKDAQQYGQGTGLGVSHQLNFSLIANGNYSVYIFTDFNPMLTEVMLPLYLKMIADAPTRSDFLSKLFGTPIHPSDLSNYFENSDHSDIESETDFFMETFYDSDAQNKTLDNILPLIFHHLSDIIKTHPDLETRIQNVVRQNSSNETLRTLLKEHLTLKRSGMDTWLTSDAFYQKVRTMILEGRIFGMTVDLTDETYPQRLNAWLKIHNYPAISTVYTSNVGGWLNKSNGPQMVKKMTGLLLQTEHTPSTRILLSVQPELHAWPQDLEHYAAVLRFLNTNNSEVLKWWENLNVNVKTFRTHKGLLHYCQQLSSNSSQWKNFLDQIDQNWNMLSGFPLNDFKAWSHDTIKYYRWDISVDSDIFRALCVELNRMGLIQIKYEY